MREVTPIKYNIEYNIVKKIYEILLKDKLISEEEYEKLMDKLRRECYIARQEDLPCSIT